MGSFKIILLELFFDILLKIINNNEMLFPAKSLIVGLYTAFYNSVIGQISDKRVVGFFSHETNAIGEFFNELIVHECSQCPEESLVS